MKTMEKLENKTTCACYFRNGNDKVSIIEPQQTQKYIRALFNLHLNKSIDAIYIMPTKGIKNGRLENMDRTRQEGYLKANALNVFTREQKGLVKV